jgi:hypothetical protein
VPAPIDGSFRRARLSTIQGSFEIVKDRAIFYREIAAGPRA